MEAVDWTGLGTLAAIVLGAIGYLARQMKSQVDQVHARFERLETRMDQRFDQVDARIDRLEERYVRHLEAHATGH